MQVTSTSNNSDPAALPAASRVPQKTLGQSDFLKLITVQLTKQDPMKPMEDTSFIGQMAQFTSLEQTGQLVKQFGLMRSSTDLASSSALLGRQVTVKSTQEGELTGTVDAVDTTSGQPKLFIGGKLFSLDAVLRVEPAAVPATTA